MESIDIAEVLLKGLRLKPLSYKVPSHMNLVVGSRVEVPLRGKKVTGTVIALKKSPPPKFTLQEIISTAEPLSLSLMAFANWLSNYYMTPLPKVLDLFFPKITSLKKVPQKEPSSVTFDFLKVEEKKLHKDQKEALDKIEKSLAEGKFSPHLLFGVTGSGKTEVFLRAIKMALSLKKNALYLVPEIALTDQLEERIRSRFSEKVVFLHSRLSPKEKRENWQALLQKEAPICVGARSALFAPLSSIGLIIVDEEHEASYKQSEEAPRYHARDAAVMRAKFENATVILGSATPSLESYANAEKGKYTLSILHERNQSSLPKVHIVDMKREHAHQGRFTLFSDRLLEGIRDRFKKGEQSLLFLNRRGWYALQKCTSCGESMKCTHCDISFTYHKSEKKLSCHLCDKTIDPPSFCPHCKKEGLLQFKGYGTEQVEGALHALFPELRILRLDRDTTKKRGSQQENTRSFSRGKYDLLLGTQMIAKGLHFPEVTLAAVLNADQLLQVPEFRAGEVAFQIMTQVAGRAGRGENPGEVIFQTTLPEHPILLQAKEQDFLSFYRSEMTSREALFFPPFSHFVKIFADAPEEKEAEITISTFCRELELTKPSSLEIFPPAAPSRKKVGGRFRFQLLIKGPSATEICRFIKPFLEEKNDSKTIRWGIDVNPLSIF